MAAFVFFEITERIDRQFVTWMEHMACSAVSAGLFAHLLHIVPQIGYLAVEASFHCGWHLTLRPHRIDTVKVLMMQKVSRFGLFTFFAVSCCWLIIGGHRFYILQNIFFDS